MMAKERVETEIESADDIPPITDPLGRHWGQPDRTEILIDGTHAVMTTRTFELLAEYSATNPSGVYEGKMWRRHDGLFDPRCLPKDRRWLLCWFGFSKIGPGFVSNNYREILIAD